MFNSLSLGLFERDMHASAAQMHMHGREPGKATFHVVVERRVRPRYAHESEIGTWSEPVHMT